MHFIFREEEKKADKPINHHCMPIVYNNYIQMGTVKEYLEITKKEKEVFVLGLILHGICSLIISIIMCWIVVLLTGLIIHEIITS